MAVLLIRNDVFEKRKKTNMYLNEEECLEEEVKKHVCDDLTDTREWLSFAARNFKS